MYTNYTQTQGEGRGGGEGGEGGREGGGEGGREGEGGGGGDGGREGGEGRKEEVIFTYMYILENSTCSCFLVSLHAFARI